ncbi:MAG: hypothetical protein HRT41_02240 [Campylobacteraceae bacterium]|nr:hypothetical protein [Campylobacteraceae bacterium]
MSVNNLINSKKSFWDKRENLKNKPSLSHRSLEVISFLMERDSVALGIAIERVMSTDGLYDEILDELSEDFDDIKKG